MFYVYTRVLMLGGQICIALIMKTPNDFVLNILFISFHLVHILIAFIIFSVPGKGDVLFFTFVPTDLAKGQNLLVYGNGL